MSVASPQFRVHVSDENGKFTTIQMPVQSAEDAKAKAIALGFEVHEVIPPDVTAPRPSVEDLVEAKTDDRLAIIFAVCGWVIVPLVIGAFVFGKRARVKSNGALGGTALTIAWIAVGIYASVLLFIAATSR